MKQQRQPRMSIGWLVATAIVLASASSFAEDNVQSGGGFVSEIYGRASTPIPGTNPVRSISSKVNVSNVFGRSSGGLASAAGKWRSDNQTAALHR